MHIPIVISIELAVMGMPVHFSIRDAFWVLYKELEVALDIVVFPYLIIIPNYFPLTWSDSVFLINDKAKS